MNDRDDDILDETDHGLTGDSDAPEVYLTWEYSEAERYQRGSLWYFGMTAAGLGLLLYALAYGNFLFALIIIMFGIVTYLSSVNAPRDVRVTIDEDGVRVGGAFYDYTELAHFWFAYEPPYVKNLYLDPKEPWKPQVVVKLDDLDPNVVRSILSVYVVEDLTKDEEPLMDTIGRVLKL